MQSACAAPANSSLTTGRTSGLAVASLVLALVGLIFNPLLIPAIVFGAVAVGQTGKDSSLGGKGMAVAGLVIGIVGVVAWLLVLAVLFLFLRSLRSLVVP